MAQMPHGTHGVRTSRTTARSRCRVTARRSRPHPRQSRTDGNTNSTANTPAGGAVCVALSTVDFRKP